MGYLIGEIMYGGHIVNDFDRLLCNCYLEYFLRDELLDEMEMFPYMDTEAGGGSGSGNNVNSFKAPQPTTYDSYLQHIDQQLLTESPIAFGMHTNAEIGFRTEQCNVMLKTIVHLQPNLAAATDGEGHSVQHAADAVLQEVADSFRDVAFDMEEIRSTMDEPGPFQNVFLQECETMNALISQMLRTLDELNLGFQGDLTMTTAMETLMHDLFFDRVPQVWFQKPFDFPSLRPLGGWVVNLRSRIDQLQQWCANPLEPPRVTWIPGLFNPQR